MPHFKVAHVREQGVDLIITPLESSFQYKSKQDQVEFVDELEAHAHAAGLAGTVVPIWFSGNSMGFLAPTQWHSFFKSLSWDLVMANINKEIYW